MKKTIIIITTGAILAAAPYTSFAQKAGSVETKKPNSNYEPAFEGQTRVPTVVTKSAYEGKVLSSSLKRPWGIASMPDGRFIVTELGGTMRIVTSSI